jgi:hypothetical protein
MSERIPVVPDDEVTIDGQPYSQPEIERRVDAMLAKRQRNLVPGGKSLSESGRHSPLLQVRIPEAMRDELHARADAEGVSVSKLTRRAIDRFLNAS